MKIYNYKCLYLLINVLLYKLHNETHVNETITAQEI